MATVKSPRVEGLGSNQAYLVITEFPGEPGKPPKEDRVLVGDPTNFVDSFNAISKFTGVSCRVVPLEFKDLYRVSTFKNGRPSRVIREYVSRRSAERCAKRARWALERRPEIEVVIESMGILDILKQVAQGVNA